MMASFKPKSVVFDYFEMPDDTSGKYRAKCKQCTATVAAIGMTTSNLLIHLKNRMKSEKLHITKRVLLTIAQFLQKFLALANAHNCDFITKDLWKKLITPKIADQLLLMSEEELKRLLISEETVCSEASHCVRCHRKQTEMTLITDIKNAKESLKETFPATRGKLNKNQQVNWDNVLSVGDFLSVVSLHNELIKHITTDLSDQHLSGKGNCFKKPVSEVHIQHGMTEKKSHEIQLMTELCASLVRSHGLSQVVDIGSGRGYLGCQLSLTHKLNVLGIDSSSVNTRSAEKRTSKVQKYWPGLMKKALENASETENSEVDPSKSDCMTQNDLTDCGCKIDTFAVKDTVKDQTNCKHLQAPSEKLGSGCYLLDHSGEVILQGLEASGKSNSPKGATQCDTKPDKNSCEKSTAHCGKCESLYVPITFYVTPRTDIWQLVCDNMHGLNGTDVYSSNILLTGLHTCGDLASSILRLFTRNDNVQAVCNVGCCYHHIEEEFVCSPFRQEDDVSSDFGFPLSQTLRETRFQLGRNARMLACQSTNRLAQNQKLPNISLFWRALLQVILHDITGQLRDDWQVGKIAAKCQDFKSYVRKAFVKLEIVYQISDEDIQAYETKYHSYHQKLQAFFQLKAALAPVIELFILVDRLCFLLEQEGTKEAHLIKLFDEVVSPRCYAIVATK